MIDYENTEVINVLRISISNWTSVLNLGTHSI